jgi:hypothetical protein
LQREIWGANGRAPTASAQAGGRESRQTRTTSNHQWLRSLVVSAAISGRMRWGIAWLSKLAKNIL